MKKDGFIATSLIYSFFLVFIAIIAALLNNYIAHKTILERFNDTVEENLNSDSHTVTVYAKNFNIQGGVVLTNLVSNGDFSNGVNFWSVEGNATFAKVNLLGSTAVQKRNNNHTNSYIYQNIYFLRNRQYYFSIDYAKNISILFNNYIGGYTQTPTLEATIQDPSTWTRLSSSFLYSSTDRNLRYIVGDSGNVTYNSAMAYFTHAMVINLTASFGRDYEPDKSWIDKNIRWFDGTISFIKEENIDDGNEIEITLEPYYGVTSMNVNCTSENNVPPTYSRDKKTENGVTYWVLTISNVNSNITCDIS